MFKKSQARMVVILIAVLIVAFTFSGAFAAAPLAVHIEFLDFIGASGETFYASGPAVDAGLICSTGTVDDLRSYVSGNPYIPILILNIHKRFYCENGTFDIFMIARLNTETGATTARWHLKDGIENYLGVSGAGSLIGTPVDPGVSVYDVYDGRVH